MKYSIFIYTITHLDGDLTICQCYCKGISGGLMALSLISGCMDSQIDYISQEATTDPCNWDYLTNNISLSN